MAFGATLTNGLTTTAYHIFISVLLLTGRAPTSHRFLDMQTGVVAAVAKNSENDYQPNRHHRPDVHSTDLNCHELGPSPLVMRSPDIPCEIGRLFDHHGTLTLPL